MNLPVKIVWWKVTLIGIFFILMAGCKAGQAVETGDKKTTTITFAAYTVPKEVYSRELIPLFQKEWRNKTGQTITFKQSYGASGAQVRAVAAGLEADVVALSLEADIDEIAKAGLITHDWKAAQNRGVITNSIVVIGVRKGNPKEIQDWEDLARTGVAVIYPNPRTSGGAMWVINAIYGAALKDKEAQTGRKDFLYAEEMLKRIQSNVKVMDKSGRESFTTFENGVGDAVVTYENELLRALKMGRPYQIIYPERTILIENPVAVVDKNVDKHSNRDVVEAFVEFLQGEEAQEVFARNGFRPTNKKTASLYASQFPTTENIFDVDYLGGWDTVEKTLYGPQGGWNRIVEELAAGSKRK